MSKDVTLLEEISEQDLTQVNGGIVRPLVIGGVYAPLRWNV